MYIFHFFETVLNILDTVGKHAITTACYACKELCYDVEQLTWLGCMSFVFQVLYAMKLAVLQGRPVTCGNRKLCLHVFRQCSIQYRPGLELLSGCIARAFLKQPCCFKTVLLLNLSIRWEKLRLYRHNCILQRRVWLIFGATSALLPLISHKITKVVRSIEQWKIRSSNIPVLACNTLIKVENKQHEICTAVVPLCVQRLL